MRNGQRLTYEVVGDRDFGVPAPDPEGHIDQEATRPDPRRGGALPQARGGP
ncbi:hypothetical protein RchiOBHm_Chr6g0289331 [Rosa chinensis]|uniref:Uncharacterized protein n=1 Tax=Rosa chinensis TaxID=74649 RepID=A0A2P6PVN0_ROSCH|nr:hypothetical protein RchiOBHm_Chr6g0289331 [Rosa chinensis]